LNPLKIKSSRPALLLALSLTLATALFGCSGGETAARASAPAAPATLKEQIAALEKSGALPALDRSTDVKGPDANNNGVRDDIEAWIAALPITDIQKKAAMQKARGIQMKMTAATGDRVALQQAAEYSSIATACIADSFMPTFQNGYDLSLKIEALTANTKERALRYAQYNAARSGSVTSQPEGYACD
jgi:hypothetical protein